jgi:hypothetical protein
MLLGGSDVEGNWSNGVLRIADFRLQILEFSTVCWEESSDSYIRNLQSLIPILQNTVNPQTASEITESDILPSCPSSLP